jgi:DNA (cytosine-5)-methyltransferase 1
MSQYQVLDLFTGIGGFTLGLERAGMKTVAFCEIEEYPRKVLNKHWPDVPIYEDVRNVTAKRLRSDGIGRIDIVTGGFPCQDISVAGKQKGIEGERSGLWGELCRIIGDIRPRYAIVENVTALISGDNGRWFGKVLGDLAEIGYDCEWHCIPASELGAHHHRDRVWIISYPNDQRPQGSLFARFTVEKTQVAITGCCKDVPNTKSVNRNDYEPVGGDGKFEAQEIPGDRGSVFGRRMWREAEPCVGRVANGVSNYVDRLKGLGNAVVPQIPELIGRAIIANDSQIKADKR